MSWTASVVAVVLILYNGSCAGFDYSELSCSSLEPLGMRRTAKTTLGPFRIAFDPPLNEYTAGSPFKVRIESTDGGTFINAMLVTTCETCKETDEVIGTFSKDTDTVPITCGNVVASAIASANDNPKSVFSVQWTPFAGMKESLRFKASVVVDDRSWWKSITSVLLTPKSTSTTTSKPTVPPTPAPTSKSTATSEPSPTPTPTSNPTTVPTFKTTVASEANPTPAPTSKSTVPSEPAPTPAPTSKSTVPSEPNPTPTQTSNPTTAPTFETKVQLEPAPTPAPMSKPTVPSERNPSLGAKPARTCSHGGLMLGNVALLITQLNVIIATQVFILM